MIAIELIVGGVIYVLTQAGIGAIIVLLRRAGVKKYRELIESLKDLSSKNSELYSLLSDTNEPSDDPSISEERRARDVNHPYADDAEMTHRDIQLSNGTILRIRNKK
jgi:hypothetical protein